MDVPRFGDGDAVLAKNVHPVEPVVFELVHEGPAAPDGIAFFTVRIGFCSHAVVVEDDEVRLSGHRVGVFRLEYHPVVQVTTGRLLDEDYEVVLFLLNLVSEDEPFTRERIQENVHWPPVCFAFVTVSTATCLAWLLIVSANSVGMDFASPTDACLRRDSACSGFFSMALTAFWKGSFSAVARCSRMIGANFVSAASAAASTARPIIGLCVVTPTIPPMAAPTRRWPTNLLTTSDARF